MFSVTTNFGVHGALSMVYHWKSVCFSPGYVCSHNKTLGKMKSITEKGKYLVMHLPDDKRDRDD